MVEKIKYFVILILIFIILYSVFCFKLKEHFTYEVQQDIDPNYRQCQVYYIDDTEKCDQLQEYYEMNEIELYNIIQETSDQEIKPKLQEIYRNKINNTNTRNCKLVFNNWKENTDKDVKKYSAPSNPNFPLQHECSLDTGNVNTITSNSSVNTTTIDSNTSLYFQNFDYNNVYSSICYSSRNNEHDIQVNDKYFINFVCSYNLPNRQIQIQDVLFKKTSTDGKTLQDVNTSDMSTIQNGIDKYFNKYLVKTDNRLKFRPLGQNINTYKFSKDFCGITNGNTIHNIDFSLAELNLELSCNLQLSNTNILNRLGDDMEYSPDNLVTTIDSIIAEKNNEINGLDAANLNLNVTPSTYTTSVTEDSENLLQTKRSNTDNALVNYMENGYTDDLKQLLSTAITDEINTTRSQLRVTYNNFIVTITNKYEFGYIRNDALYQNDVFVSSFDDFNKLLLEETKSVSKEIKVGNSSDVNTFTTQEKQANNIVCTEITGNILIDKKYFQFYIEPHPDIEKESIEVFLTFNGNNGKRLHQKVAYKYGYQNETETMYNLTQVQKNVVYDMKTPITPYQVSFLETNIQKYKLFGSNDQTTWETISEYDINNHENFEIKILKEKEDYLDNLYCWYKFDENLQDSSGNGNNIQLNHLHRVIGVGDDTYDNVRQTGSHSFILDNDKYLTVPTTNFSTFDGFTMCVWVRLDRFTRWTRIIDFGSGPGQNNIIVSRYGETNQLAFVIFDAVANRSQWLMTNNDVIQGNNWMHIAVTNKKNADNVTATNHIYVNGEDQPVNNNKGVPVPDHTPNICFVGKSHWGEGNDPLLRGRMDDFRIYNEALSQERISKIYHGKRNIRKYPGFILGNNHEHTGNNVGGDLYYQNMNYLIKWSSDYGSWKPTHFFNSIQSSAPGGHSNNWMYDSGNQKFNRKIPRYTGTYRGEWIYLQCPNGIYPYNLRFYKRDGFRHRVPYDFKFFGTNVNTSDGWSELLHERNAVYVNKMYVSKPLIGIQSFDTFAICVKTIGYVNSGVNFVTGHVLNFDEIEIYGGSEPYEQNDRKYRYFKLDYTGNPPNMILNGPNTDLYSQYYTNDISQNNGYYGIYIRCLRNIEHAEKSINVKFKSVNDRVTAALELNRSYFETSMKINENIPTDSENILEKMLLLKSSPTENLINYSDNKRQVTSSDELTGITVENFFINCPTMPSYDTVPNLTTEINRQNLNSIFEQLGTIRSKQINDFDCLTTSDEFETLQSGFNTTSGMSNALINNIKAKQENNSRKSVIENEIIIYQNIKTQIDNFKNIRVNISELTNQIRNKSLNFTKFVKCLTNYNNTTNVFIELDVTGM